MHRSFTLMKSIVLFEDGFNNTIILAADVLISYICSGNKIQSYNQLRLWMLLINMFTYTKTNFIIIFYVLKAL